MDENRIQGAVREGVGGIKDAAGRLMGDTSTEISGRIDELAGQAQRAVGRMADDVRDTASYVSDHAGDYAMEARDRAGEATGMLADYIRANPVIALGAAFAIGVFLGRRT